MSRRTPPPHLGHVAPHSASTVGVEKDRLLQAIRWRLLPWRGHVPHVPRPLGRSFLPFSTLARPTEPRLGLLDLYLQSANGVRRVWSVAATKPKPHPHLYLPSPVLPPCQTMMEAGEGEGTYDF